jgi:hypothetical protein
VSTPQWPEPAYPAPYPHYPPPPPARPQRWWIVIVLVVALAAGGFAAWRLAGGASHDYPAHWDPRVLPLVRFVEQDRGLSFDHPIKVEFLTPSAFRARVTRGATELSARERAQLTDQVSLLRAAGLVSGRPDLAKATRDLQGGSVVGEYSFATKSIAVRGQTLTPSARVTLVHELTHGLQDQHFDAGAHERTLRARSDTEAEEAFRAVAEGDAVRVEDDYIQSLPPAERRQAKAQRDRDTAAADRAIKSVPQILIVQQAQPYVLGRNLLDFQIAAHGRTSVDRLFTEWPTSYLQIMQPWRYATGDAVRHLGRPGLRVGEREFDHGVFGEAAWYYVLAQRLGPPRALSAVSGWSGDAYVAFHRGTRVCFRANYGADSTRDLRAAAAALHRWIKAAPGNGARESTRGGVVTFETCDPGVHAARPVKSRAEAALRLAGERIQIATALLKSGLDETGAGCAAQRVVARLPQSQIESSKLTTRATQVLRSAVAACR